MPFSSRMADSSVSRFSPGRQVQHREPAVAVLRPGTLAHHRSVHRQAGQQVGAGGVDDAVHRPQAAEVGEVRRLLGVPVLGVDDEAAGRPGVGRSPRRSARSISSAPCTYSDPVGIGEVVLHVDDDQGVVGPVGTVVSWRSSCGFMPASRARWPAAWWGWPGRRRRCVRPSHGRPTIARRRCSRDSARVGSSSTGTPAAHERHRQHPIARLGVRDRAADHVDHLLGRGAAGLVPAQRRFASAVGLLVGTALFHRPAVDRDEFVDHPGGRRAGAGDQRRADPVDVDRVGPQRGDRVFVQVAGQHDLGVDRARARPAAGGPPWSARRDRRSRCGRRPVPARPP